jgi:hypothetical protein
MPSVLHSVIGVAKVFSNTTNYNICVDKSLYQLGYTLVLPAPELSLFIFVPGYATDLFCQFFPSV